MGADIEVQRGRNCDYVEALQKYVFRIEIQFQRTTFSFVYFSSSLAMVTKRMVNVLYHPNFIYKRTAAYRREQELVAASERLPEKVCDASTINHLKPFSCHVFVCLVLIS